MYNQILSRIRTKEEAQKLIDELEVLLVSLYGANGLGFESALTSKVRAWVSFALKSDWEGKGINWPDYLNQLKKKLQEFKTINLTLAFEPTDEGIEKLSNFLTSSCEQRILLDVNYDPKILGGAILVFGGKFRDFSLRRVYEDEFKKKKAEIINLLSGS